MDNTKNTATILKEFVESANRSRKYPDNTAMALKTALRLFETELREEELYSIEKFKENLDHIYQSVFEKNKTKYSSGSLDAYKRRVSRLLNDYLKYGTDPVKMNNWSPAVRKISARAQKKSAQETIKGSNGEDDSSVIRSEKGTRIDWPLTNGRNVTLVLPDDLTGQEATVIKSLIELRVVEEQD
jgi:hypothetical protein